MNPAISTFRAPEQPAELFGAEKRKLTPNDFFGVLAFSAAIVFWILLTIVIKSVFPDYWPQLKGIAFGGIYVFLVTALYFSFDGTAGPVREQRAIADRRYRVWISDVLYPYLETKYGVKLTGNPLTFDRIMAEKDGNLFEVQLFGIKHVRSNPTDQNPLWSHPVITGELQIKKVMRPDAVQYQDIPVVT